MMNFLHINRLYFVSRSAQNKLYYQPFLDQGLPKSQADCQKVAKEIVQWGQKNGAKYFSFWANPLSQGYAEKQETFLSMQFSKQNILEHLPKSKTSFNQLSKGQGDGSSFPNGSLRSTHTARAYFLWDWKSSLFIKKSSQVMYIPAMLVSHYGNALDDRTIYRKAQNKMSQSCSKLLNHLKIPNNGTCILLGLEQQLFIIPKKDYLKRIDLRQTNRALIGDIPPHNQQFSDHYYGKLEDRIQKALTEAEKILTEMGVPIKTRHKQVAPNQYQFCSIFEEASQTIDHNLLKMQVLEQVLDSHGYVPLWNEKPFLNLNGSGKHINWSLNYLEQKGNIRNLFKPEHCQNMDVFWLYFFLHAKALANNQHLFQTAISVPGNQLRLGGHEAPPRILSFAAGDHFRNLIDGKFIQKKKNLQQQLPHLLTDIMRENQDRNRTSPYAFVSNRFEYRAVGSTQNCYFPMSIIVGTYAIQIQKALKQLESGVNIKELIKRLKQQTQNIRYDGNGYDKGWQKQAEKRNLYINKHYSQNFSNLLEYGSPLIDAGIYNKSELQAKANILRQNYINTVLKQAETLLIILNKNVIPRSYKQLQGFPSSTTSKALLDRKARLEHNLERLARLTSSIQNDLENMDRRNGRQAQTLRFKLTLTGKLANNVTRYLPECPQWPELYQILGTI